MYYFLARRIVHRHLLRRVIHDACWERSICIKMSIKLNKRQIGRYRYEDATIWLRVCFSVFPSEGNDHENRRRRKTFSPLSGYFSACIFAYFSCSFIEITESNIRARQRKEEREREREREGGEGRQEEGENEE